MGYKVQKRKVQNYTVQNNKVHNLSQRQSDQDRTYSKVTWFKGTSYNFYVCFLNLLIKDLLLNFEPCHFWISLSLFNTNSFTIYFKLCYFEFCNFERCYFTEKFSGELYQKWIASPHKEEVELFISISHSSVTSHNEAIV